MDSSAAASLAIYKDAFSNSTGAAKIPDGKTISSVGARLQIAKELKNTAAGDDILHILLYPGATQGMVVWGDEGALSSRNFTASNYNDHMSYDGTLVYGAGVQADGNIINNDNINSWRCVSSALRLRLLNTVEENDGWFESIRYKDGFRANEFGFYSGDNTNQQNKLVYGPDTTLLGRLEVKNLVNSPSYETGALRDIGKYTFALQPQTEDHDFIQLRKRYWVEGDDLDIVGGGANYFTMKEDTPQTHLIHNALVDHAHDAVYIRIHCRANTGSGATTGSRILAHLCTAQEVLYDETENEHKFMTRGPTAKHHAAAANAQKRKDISSAVPTGRHPLNPYNG
jgi:hypothetical protein